MSRDFAANKIMTIVDISILLLAMSGADVAAVVAVHSGLPVQYLFLCRRVHRAPSILW